MTQTVWALGQILERKDNAARIADPSLWRWDKEASQPKGWNKTTAEWREVLGRLDSDTDQLNKTWNGTKIEWLDGALRKKVFKVTLLLVLATYTRAIWKERCIKQFDGKRAARPITRILEEGCTVSRELVAAAPHENRRETATKALADMKLLTENSRNQEIRLSLISHWLRRSDEDLNYGNGWNSGNEALSSKGERSMSNERIEERTPKDGIGELEREMEHLGFV
ncbi:hypothetical protein R1flu_003579 [Riccia fluitans]|uniref:Uncharacterized protein n=1 Tax=Riccia fluitans TaxID=41844 RepID=A0ABD1YD26_9MARC